MRAHFGFRAKPPSLGWVKNMWWVYLASHSSGFHLDWRGCVGDRVMGASRVNVIRIATNVS